MAKEVIHYFSHGYGILCGVSEFCESSTLVEDVTCHNCKKHMKRNSPMGTQPAGGTSLCCVCGESDPALILGDDGRLYCPIHDPKEI